MSLYSYDIKYAKRYHIKCPSNGFQKILNRKPLQLFAWFIA